MSVEEKREPLPLFTYKAVFATAYGWVPIWGGYRRRKGTRRAFDFALPLDLRREVYDAVKRLSNDQYQKSRAPYSSIYLAPHSPSWSEFTTTLGPCWVESCSSSFPELRVQTVDFNNADAILWVTRLQLESIADVLGKCIQRDQATVGIEVAHTLVAELLTVTK